MEQNKNKTLAKEFEKKILDDILQNNETEDQEVLNLISSHPELQTKIDQILNNIENNLTSIDTEIVSLLGALTEEIDNLNPVSSIDKLQFSTKMNSLRIYLMLMRTKLTKVKGLTKNKNPVKEKLLEEDKKITIQIKKNLEKFMVYEIYKILNPRKIAGETRLDNFINNMITGGLKRASKYEGGKAKDLRKYSPSLIKKLNKQHSKFNKKGIRGIW